MQTEPLLLANARVLDVEAGRYHDGQAVLIENGHITSIADTTPSFAGRRLDLGGRVLLRSR